MIASADRVGYFTIRRPYVSMPHHFLLYRIGVVPRVCHGYTRFPSTVAAHIEGCVVPNWPEGRMTRRIENLSCVE